MPPKKKDGGNNAFGALIINENDASDDLDNDLKEIEPKVDAENSALAALNEKEPMIEIDNEKDNDPEKVVNDDEDPDKDPNMTELPEVGAENLTLAIEIKKEEIMTVSEFLDMNTRLDTMMQLMQQLGFKEVIESTYKMRLLYNEKADKVKATENAELRNKYLMFSYCIN